MTHSLQLNIKFKNENPEQGSYKEEGLKIEGSPHFISSSRYSNLMDDTLKLPGGGGISRAPSTSETPIKIEESRDEQPEDEEKAYLSKYQSMGCFEKISAPQLLC
jgi:hypothetical protein